MTVIYWEILSVDINKLLQAYYKLVEREVIDDI